MSRINTHVTHHKQNPSVCPGLHPFRHINLTAHIHLRYLRGTLRQPPPPEAMPFSHAFPGMGVAQAAKYGISHGSTMGNVSPVSGKLLAYCRHPLAPRLTRKFQASSRKFNRRIRISGFHEAWMFRLDSFPDSILSDILLNPVSDRRCSSEVTGTNHEMSGMRGVVAWRRRGRPREVAASGGDGRGR